MKCTGKKEIFFCFLLFSFFFFFPNVFISRFLPRVKVGHKVITSHLDALSLLEKGSKIPFLEELDELGVVKAGSTSMVSRLFFITGEPRVAVTASSRSWDVEENGMRPGHLALERQDEGSADPSKANLPREEEVIRDGAMFDSGEAKKHLGEQEGEKG